MEAGAQRLRGGCWGFISGAPGDAELFSHVISAIFSIFLTIPTRVFEVPIFSSSIINEDHEDKS